MEEQMQKAPVEMTNGKRAAVVAGAAVMILSVALSGTGIGLNMSAILARFNATEMYGVVTVLGVLCMTLASPVGASLAMLHGIKKMAVVAGLAALASSVAAAICITAGLVPFILSRCFLSFSFGLITGGLYPIASYVYAPHESGKGYGIFTAAIALGGVVGGTVAGYLADAGLVAWSIAYPGVLALLGSAPVFLLFPGFREKARKTDFVGLVLLVFVLCFLLFPLSFYQSLGWSSPFIIGSLLLFVLAGVLLYRYEKRQAHPLIPFHLLRNRGYLAACLIGLVGTGIFTTLQSSYLPILSQSVLGTSSFLSGLVPLPKTILTIILPTFMAAWLAKKKGRHWKILTAQGLFVLVPSVVLALVSKPGTSPLFVMALVGLVGVAESCKGAGLNNYAQSQLALTDVSQGIALLGLVSTAATAVASAVFGMQLNGWAPLALYPETIKSQLDPTQLAALAQTGSYMGGSTALPDMQAALPGELQSVFEAAVQAARESLGTSIGSMFLVCAATGLAVIAISVFLVRKKTDS